MTHERINLLVDSEQHAHKSKSIFKGTCISTCDNEQHDLFYSAGSDRQEVVHMDNQAHRWPTTQRDNQPGGKDELTDSGPTKKDNQPGGKDRQTERQSTKQKERQIDRRRISQMGRQHD